MGIIGVLLALLGLLGFFVGLLGVIWPIQRLGFVQRRTGGFVIALSFGAMIVAVVLINLGGGDTSIQGARMASAATAVSAPTIGPKATAAPTATATLTPSPTASPTATSAPTAVATPEPTFTPTSIPPTPTPSSMQVGQTLTFTSSGQPVLDVTLNGARWGDSTIFRPATGTKWLVINMSLKNESAESRNISSLLQLRLIDDQGYRRDIAFGVNKEGQIGGQLQPGAVMRGEEAFVVRNDSTNWRLTFQPEMFSSSLATWDIPIGAVQ